MDVKENKLIAYFWFACALVTAGTTLLVLNTKGIFLIPGILGISSILLLVGRQRISKLKLNSDVFNVYVGNFALFTAIWCGVTFAIIETVGK